MITINKGAGLITGITATASYLFQSYSKKTPKTTKNKTKNPHQSWHTFIMSQLSRKPETTNSICAELTTS